MTNYTAYSDGELLEFVAQENQHAFDELYSRYWKKVLTVAVHKLQDVPEAEGVVQDIFLSLWRRKSQLVITNSINNYLMASVKYRVIRVLDKRRQQRLFEEQSIHSIDILDDSTQNYLNFSELSRKLEALVGNLPETCRLVYKLNKEEGMSYRDIALKMGLSEKAVDGHLVRAKKSLRASLGSYFFSFLL
jgi:RNA polymerase sigma-70 factor (family 1)